jgi:hypothetical protein
MVVGTLLGVWIGRDLRKEFAAPASGDGPPDGSGADDDPFASQRYRRGRHFFSRAE